MTPVCPRCTSQLAAKTTLPRRWECANQACLWFHARAITPRTYLNRRKALLATALWHRVNARRWDTSPEQSAYALARIRECQTILALCRVDRRELYLPATVVVPDSAPAPRLSARTADFSRVAKRSRRNGPRTALPQDPARRHVAQARRPGPLLGPDRAADAPAWCPLMRRERSKQPAAPWVASGANVTRKFTHPSGWIVQHCGHPTALQPWACYSPDGYLHRHGCVGAGRAFVRVDDAIAHAEAHLAEGPVLAETRLDQLLYRSIFAVAR